MQECNQKLSIRHRAPGNGKSVLPEAGAPADGSTQRILYWLCRQWVTHYDTDELPEKVVALPMDKTAQKNLVYCTGIFGKAISELSEGKKLEDIGDVSVSIHVKNALRPMLGNNWIEGQIIFIDNFENVIVNITQEEFEAQRKGRSFKIVFKRDEVIERISDTYADVPEGEKLAMFNSASYLEIAINKGNAAGLFGLQGFSEKQVQSQNQYVNNRLFYQTVKVYFE